MFTYNITIRNNPVPDREAALPVFRRHRRRDSERDLLEEFRRGGNYGKRGVVLVAGSGHLLSEPFRRQPYPFQGQKQIIPAFHYQDAAGAEHRQSFPAGNRKHISQAIYGVVLLFKLG